MTAYYKESLTKIFQSACGVPVFCDVIESHSFKPEREYSQGIHVVYHFYTKKGVTKQVNLSSVASAIEKLSESIKCSKPKVVKWVPASQCELQFIRLGETKYSEAYCESITGFVSANAYAGSGHADVGSLDAVITYVS
nr:MAG TPA: hypothetical protein [Caudoviricetes sp.]